MCLLETKRTAFPRHYPTRMILSPILATVVILPGRGAHSLKKGNKLPGCSSKSKQI
ncbi:MAG: hypothetical protein ILP18_08850 [Treponema sp.]|nr:hypothetical protein [Treponema sp.]